MSTNPRSPALLAALLLLAGAPGGEAGARPVTPGTLELCTFPVRWHIADVDPAFGLSLEDVQDAVRQAAMLWEEAVGRPLLFQEGQGGIAVRLVFDERQRVAYERREREEALGERARGIEDSAAALEELRGELERRRTAHDRRQFDLRDRMEAHARTVEYWNSVGGAPADEFRRLQAEGEALDGLQRQLNEESDEINALVNRINAETERLNREISELNDARAILARDVPVTVLQSAEYRETRRFLGPITREIDIFHFEDRNHLVLLLAHELGHSLGLEHSDIPGSIMVESAPYDPAAGRPRPHPSDADALRALCPALS